MSPGNTSTEIPRGLGLDQAPNRICGGARRRTHRVGDVVLLPRPVQQPRIPIWVGGWWPNRPPARRAARWDGMFPVHRNWPTEALTAQDYRALSSFISSLRHTDAPFDLAATTT